MLSCFFKCLPITVPFLFAYVIDGLERQEIILLQPFLIFKSDSIDSPELNPGDAWGVHNVYTLSTVISGNKNNTALC